MQLLKLSHIQGLPDDPIQISITDDCCKSPELDTHSQTSNTHIKAHNNKLQRQEEATITCETKTT